MSGADETEARALIAALGLQPHPEGGWYAETWRAEAKAGARASGTAIYYLLEAGQRSHWHRVDAAEIWHHYAGAALRLLTAPDASGPVESHLLGPDIARGARPQHLVPAHAWQSAETTTGWALVGCTVSPGFEFQGFEMAPPGWSPDQGKVRPA